MGDLPRGIRNNNPGNIDRTGTQWQGMAADQSGDRRFIVFETPEWGIRAIVRVLRSYRDKHGLKTVRGIISRWAPPAENPTHLYIAFVTDRLGVDPDDPIDIDDFETLRTLVRAIVRKECGPGPLAEGDWYEDAVIAEGIRRAA
ncbi:MAG: structural protein [Alphaproteobacteria bacterium]